MAAKTINEWADYLNGINSLKTKMYPLAHQYDVDSSTVEFTKEEAELIWELLYEEYRNVSNAKFERVDVIAETTPAAIQPAVNA